ncbi:Aldo/keto reductase [Macrolepiota fuliginosa MF-IS2]|uniref:Aldo/keto reductase n=1 Tax=Macrolepiota fuliginosa MF-IS2 TaxID=1400762 RepID=A0A9P6C2T2_9AGAR|nr:Aldo/keto reductase [Macrolepiota fuliginosa MF-IS2]
MPVIPTRKIRADNVPGLGLGLMGLSIGYGQVESDEERLKFLDTALEEGWTFWDSADVYGDSEDLVGKWYTFKRTGNRDKIFLATKFGFVRTNPRGVDGSPEYVKSACKKSLERLGINQIDLYYLHRPDSTVPIEVCHSIQLQSVRYLGLSEVSSATLRRAHAVHPISAVQVEYSPFTLFIEDEKVGLLKTCRELGVPVIAYSPLGRGLLTGQFKSPDDFEEGDWRRTLPRFSKENYPKVLQIVDGLTEIGKKHDATAGQVALAWILAQGTDVIPIPGMKKTKYLKENLGAINITLTEDEKAKVRKLAEDSEIMSVDRYPASMMEALLADTPPL